MLGLFYFLVLVEIAWGLYSLWEGVRWLELARKSLQTPTGLYTPRVALVCPCKGLEPGLEQNLSALTDFDYPNYQLYLAIASAHDPAEGVLRRVVSRSKVPAKIVVAGAPRDCGEKVNNLRAAIEAAGEEFEVYVFADSDGRPPRHWLRHLVAPLVNASVGAATTFRWYLPQRGGFWSALATAWNAAIATLLGAHSRNFCWGGGTAIRREVFEQVGGLEAWKGAVSDDWSLTRALRQAERRIHFVPECLVPSVLDTDFAGLLDFTNRQIKITRVYAPGLWKVATLVHALYCATALVGTILLLSTWWRGNHGLHILLLLLAPALLAAGKGYLRLLAVTELLPVWEPTLVEFGWAWTLLAPVVPFLYVWNSLVALTSRRICWRGVHYEMISPVETRILSP